MSLLKRQTDTFSKFVEAHCNFNQGRQITKIEIDFESKSRECVKSKE